MTKQARYDELDGEGYRDYDHDVDGRGGWQVSHVEDDEDSVDSPWSTRAHRDPSLPPSKASSDGSMLSTHEAMMLRGAEDDDDEEEDDFVFCLEL